jgi:hypothetical protein
MDGRNISSTATVDALDHNAGRGYDHRLDIVLPSERILRARCARYLLDLVITRPYTIITKKHMWAV